MTLAAKVHELWAADATLIGLLPVAKLHTGIYVADEPAFPYCVVSFPDDSHDGGDNVGEFSRAIVRFALYLDQDSYDEGAPIVKAIYDVFNRTTFTVDSSVTALLMSWQGNTILPTDEGDWVFAEEYSVMQQVR